MNAQETLRALNQKARGLYDNTLSHFNTVVNGNSSDKAHLDRFAISFLTYLTIMLLLPVVPFAINKIGTDLNFNYYPFAYGILPFIYSSEIARQLILANNTSKKTKKNRSF